MLAAAAMRLGGAAALPTAAAAAAAFAPACHTAFAKLAPSLVHLERFSASRVSLDGCMEPWRRLVQCPPPTACTSQILAGTHAGTGAPGQHCSPALFPCLQFAPKAAEPALAEEVSGKFCPAAAAAGSMQGAGGRCCAATGRPQAWSRARRALPHIFARTQASPAMPCHLKNVASPAAPSQEPFVPQMHPGMARDDACDRSAAIANTPAGGKFTDSYM